MSVTRRRFIAISAAFAALPAMAEAHSWHGRAFGAEVSLSIRGPRRDAVAALNEARALIAQIEALFSLYEPQSALSKLNATGKLIQPNPHFVALMRAADRAVRLTDGLFDPTVQPLWQALAQGLDITAAQHALGWDRVRFDASAVTLDAHQALTFNGIAQGFATDLVADALGARGLQDTLVNIGEYRANGGPWTLGLSDPLHGRLGQRRLTGGAMATSSPAATPLGDQGHILHASARPHWSSVTVEAQRATLADSLSTALVLATRDQIEAIKHRAGIHGVTLVDFEGDLITL